MPGLYTRLFLQVRGGEAPWLSKFGFSRKVLLGCKLSKFRSPRGRSFSESDSAIEFVIQFAAILLLHMADADGDPDSDSEEL